MPDDRRVLADVSTMVVDGTNVLHALSRAREPAPATALIGRLRAIVPPGVGIVVVLDGSPEHGLVARQVASGVEVRYSGRSSADDLIAAMLERSDATGVLVVSDDIALSETVRRSGGRTVRTGWLVDRLGRQRLSAPAPGRPQGPQAQETQNEATDEEPRWKPGRGATRKRGNPRRGRTRPG